MWSGFQIPFHFISHFPHSPCCSHTGLFCQPHKKQAQDHLRAFILLSPLPKTFFPYLLTWLSLLIFLKKYAWILYQTGLPQFSYTTCPLPPLCSISPYFIFLPSRYHHLTYCMLMYCCSLPLNKSFIRARISSILFNAVLLEYKILTIM